MELPKRKGSLIEILPYSSWQQKVKRLNGEFERSVRVEQSLARYGYKLIILIELKGKSFTKCEMHRLIVQQLWERYDVADDIFIHPIVYVEKNDCCKVYAVE